MAKNSKFLLADDAAALISCGASEISSRRIEISRASVQTAVVHIAATPVVFLDQGGRINSWAIGGAANLFLLCHSVDSSLSRAKAPGALFQKHTKWLVSRIQDGASAVSSYFFESPKFLRKTYKSYGYEGSAGGCALPHRRQPIAATL